MATPGSSSPCRWRRSADRAPRHCWSLPACLLLAVRRWRRLFRCPSGHGCSNGPTSDLSRRWPACRTSGGAAPRSSKAPTSMRRRLPWTYVPTWLLYTTPTGDLGGRGARRRHAGAPVARIAWEPGVCSPRRCFLWPTSSPCSPRSTTASGICCSSCRRSRRWRHSGGVPPFEARRPAVRLFAALALMAGLAEPIGFSIRNHPNQAVYFNPLLGGPRRAVGRFELDYWGNCLYQAQRHVAAMAIRAGMPITVSGARWRIMMLNRGRIPTVGGHSTRSGATSSRSRAHARIPRASCAQQSGRGDLVDRIETADGAVLCSIVTGPEATQSWRLVCAADGRVAALGGFGVACRSQGVSDEH